MPFPFSKSCRPIKWINRRGGRNKKRQEHHQDNHTTSGVTVGGREGGWKAADVHVDMRHQHAPHHHGYPPPTAALLHPDQEAKEEEGRGGGNERGRSRAINHDRMVNQGQGDDDDEFWRFKSQGIDAEGILAEDGPVRRGVVDRYIHHLLFITSSLFTSLPSLFQPCSAQEALILLEEVLLLKEDHRFKAAAHGLDRIEVGR